MPGLPACIDCGKLAPGAVAPAIVCDPFSGAGTTALTARALGRHGVGLDLSLEYVKLSRDRLGLTALDQWEGRGPTQAPQTYDDLPLFAMPEEGR